MLLEEKIRIGLFAGAVLAVYAAALVIVVHAAARSLQRRRGLTPQPLGRATRRVRAAVLALALAGTGCAAYARLIEPTWLEVTHVRIESDRLPRGARPIRLVHISDVHSDPVARLEEQPARRHRGRAPGSRSSSPATPSTRPTGWPTSAA